jgi:eukaryotic-like serine/threonine-protein kinase
VLEAKKLESRPTVDEVLRRWQSLKDQNQSATVEDLCADDEKKSADLRQHLLAVASMISFLGLDVESVSTGPISTEGVVPDGSSPTLKRQPSGLGVDTAEPAKSVQVPGYEVLEELGRGGMGVVYRARQQSLDRIVALKMILSASHAGSSATARFLHEAKTIALLKHPHLVQVCEYGSHEGKPFFSLEYLEGGSLADKLRGEPQPPTQAAQTVQSLAEAVQAAHEQGIVHRDLKPANVLLAADGTPKITDFGVAKQGDWVITATGDVLGTPSYMAPEQAEGKTKLVGPAADIYALGAILYELLTGRPPFKGASAWETIQLVTNSEPVTPCQLQPGVPRDLETICLKCLEKDPAVRYATAEDLAGDLRRFRSREPIHARPVGGLERTWRWCLRNQPVAASVAAVALSLLAAAVVSVVFGLHAEQSREAEAEGRRGETKAKQEAVQARRDVQQQLIDLSAESGLTAAREGDHSLALLWFARTAQLAGEYPERDELSRIRYGNWLRHVWTPEGTWAVPGFRRDKDQFREFRFSPDGNFLLSVERDGNCLVWDRSGEHLVPLSGPAAHASAAAWEPTAGLLAVGGKDGKVRLLAPPSFQPVEELPAEGDLLSLEFSRDGRRLAWGGDRGARVWDREKRQFLSPLLSHDGPVVTVAFSSDQALLATSSRDGKARVFRALSGSSNPLFTPVPHVLAEYGINHGGPDRVAPRFVADDSTLLTVERSGDLYHLQWRSAETGKVLRTTKTIPGHDFLGAFDVSSTGDRVAVAWADGLVRMLDARTGSILAAVPTEETYWIEDLAFSTDGRSIVTGGHNMKVETWLVEENRNLGLVRAFPAVSHPKQVVRVALSRDGNHLAVALWDGMICFWRVPQGPQVAYQIEAGGATWVELSPDQRLLLPRGTSFRGGSLRETQVHDATTGKPVGPRLAPGGIVVDASFNPDGTQVAIAVLTAQTPDDRGGRVFEADGKAGNVQVWDWKGGKRLVGPVPLPAEPRGLTFRPDGRTVAVVCADYRVVLVDPATGAIRHNLDPGIRTKPFNANLWTTNGESLFSPDGRFLLTWERVPTLHIWDPELGRLVQILEHTERIENAAFNPKDPHVLATGGRDSMLKVWDLSAKKLLLQLPHPRWVQKLTFSPDGSELISSCSDGLIRSWNWRTGELNRALPHNDDLLGFDFTKDRRWLAVSSTKSLELTDWRSGAPAAPEWSLRGGLSWGCVIPAGDHRVVVGGFDGRITGFDLEKIVTPVTAPAEDLMRVAEVVAGRRITNDGNLVPISSNEWSDRWKELQRNGWPKQSLPR